MTDKMPKDKRILLAAERIFSMYGFEKATLDQIISLADVGKGTVYKYFGNKEMLFYKLVQEKNGPFAERLQAVVQNAQGVEGKLLAYFKEMITFYIENVHLWQIICFEMMNANNGVRVEKCGSEHIVVSRYEQLELSEEMKERTLRYHYLLREEYIVLEQILVEGLREGVLKHFKDSEVAAKYLFFGVAMSIFHPTKSLFETITAEEAAKIVVDRYLYGVVKR